MHKNLVERLALYYFLPNHRRMQIQKKKKVRSYILLLTFQRNVSTISAKLPDDSDREGKKLYGRLFKSPIPSRPTARGIL